MDLTTPREKLIAEAHYNQGYQDGIAASLQMIQKRGVGYSQGVEDGVRSVTGPNIARVKLALEVIFNEGAATQADSQ